MYSNGEHNRDNYDRKLKLKNRKSQIFRQLVLIYYLLFALFIILVIIYYTHTLLLYNYLHT